jgi:hypothetical protein
MGAAGAVRGQLDRACFESARDSADRPEPLRGLNLPRPVRTPRLLNSLRLPETAAGLGIRRNLASVDVLRWT